MTNPTRDRISLDRLSIASPCTADWSTMKGDAKSRFCAECKLHVHDLSAMTRAEAEAKLREASQGNRLCVRFYRRADGKVLTQDCPVGWRLRARRAWARAVALALALLGSLTGCTRRSTDGTEGGAGLGGLMGKPLSRPMGEVEMGDMVAPTTRPERPTMGIAAPDPRPTSQPHK